MQDEAAALRAREPQAIDNLVREHQELIRKFLYRFVSDAETVRNLVQETFYQALRSIDGFRGGSQVSTWLCSIAKHVAIAHLRKARRQRAVTSDTLDYVQAQQDSGPAQFVPPFAPNPQDDLERGERQRLVRDAIDQLRPSYRTVLTLRDLHELSTAEVADRLSITEVNVRVRLHRARKALRNLLAAHFDEPAVA